MEQVFTENMRTYSFSLGEKFQIYLIQFVHYTGQEVKVIGQAPRIQIFWLPGPCSDSELCEESGNAEVTSTEIHPWARQGDSCGHCRSHSNG